MRKLMIVSASSLIRKKPEEPIPAVQRYDGVCFRVIRKNLTKQKVDVVVVSEPLGIVSSEQKISYHRPSPGKWGNLTLDPEKLEEARATNLEGLKKILESKKYDEIYVNIGKIYQRLIAGYDNLIPCKITVAKGKNIGQKMQHMKQWLSSLNKHG